MGNYLNFGKTQVTLCLLISRVLLFDYLLILQVKIYTYNRSLVLTCNFAPMMYVKLNYKFTLKFRA